MPKRHKHNGGLALRSLIYALIMSAFGGIAAVAWAHGVGKPPNNSSAVLTGHCLNPTARLTVEEHRLTYRLPKNSNPKLLQAASFGKIMIDGGGFEHYGPQLIGRLCSVADLHHAKEMIRGTGKQLWQMAVRRAHHHTSSKAQLPYSDDRPLYWTRLQAEAVLRQWLPRFVLSPAQRKDLITLFDKASRGMFSFHFPTGKHVKRVIMSGFDPYTLDGGPSGQAPEAAGNHIRHGNPSGALALAIDGTSYKDPDGQRVFIQAYILPVDYPRFRRGYLENTVGQFMQRGPRQVNASVTVSQAGSDQFNLEQWNGRYHGTYPDNGNFEPCPRIGATPELALKNPACNISVVAPWERTESFLRFNPPQWTKTTLPVAKMIAANTGKNVPRPAGDSWPDTSVAFGVVWHTNYTEFPDCESPKRVTRNRPVPKHYPPANPPTPPTRNSCSYSGGGGNYLSNESAYRNTLLRDRLGLHIPAGHIHTPDMQHFDEGDLYKPSDATFNAWRMAIVEQAEKLIHVAANNAP